MSFISRYLKAPSPPKPEEKVYDRELMERVYSLIGAASVCWKGAPSGEFLSDRAIALGEEFLWFLDENYDLKATK